MNKYIIDLDKLEPISEKVLDLALDVFINTPNLMEKSFHIISQYTLYDMAINQNIIEFTEDDFTKNTSKLIKNYSLERLVNENLLDIEFLEKGPKYYINKKGKEAKQIISLTSKVVAPSFKETILCGF